MSTIPFDPYTQPSISDSRFAAFDIGRRLERMYFHLQLYFLFSASPHCNERKAEQLLEGLAEGNPRLLFARQISLAAEKNLDSCKQIQKTLPSAIYQIVDSGPDKLAIIIQTISNRMRDALGDGSIPQYLIGEIQEYLRRIRNADDDLKLSIVEDFIASHANVLIDGVRDFQKRIGAVAYLNQGSARNAPDGVRTFILDKLPAEFQALLVAGSILEEGLCRRDIFRVIYQRLPLPTSNFNDTLVDVEGSYQVPEELFTYEKVENIALTFDGLPRFFNTVRFDPVSIRPGSIPPECDWYPKLRKVWQVAGLDENLLPAKWPKSATDEQLQSHRDEIEKTYQTLFDALTRGDECEVDEPTEDLPATPDGIIEPTSFCCDGVQIDFGRAEQEFQLLKALWNAPGRWMHESVLRPKVVGDKPSDLVHTQKHLNERLSKEKIPITISKNQERFILETLRSSAE